jgi:hypothetical protein
MDKSVHSVRRGLSIRNVPAVKDDDLMATGAQYPCDQQTIDATADNAHTLSKCHRYGWIAEMMIRMLRKIKNAPKSSENSGFARR